METKRVRTFGFDISRKVNPVNLLALLCLLFFACAAVDSYGEIPAPLPKVQGWYDYCSASSPSCLADLDQIAAGGFKLVINYAVLYDSTSAQVLAYADHANSLGIKIAWDLSDSAFYTRRNPAGVSYFKKFAKGCDCSTLDGFVTYYVNTVKNHPATWGYYVGDETDPRYARVVSGYSDLVRTLDPNVHHPRLFVFLGDPSLSVELNNISAFLPSLDMIGEDFYPIGGPGTTLRDFADAVANLQAIATQSGKRSTIAEQAMSWADYPPGFCTPFPSCEPFPTYRQLLDMHDLTLQNSDPVILLYYSLFDIHKSNNPKKHWADVMRVAFAPDLISSTPASETRTAHDQTRRDKEWK